MNDLSSACELSAAHKLHTPLETKRGACAATAEMRNVVTVSPEIVARIVASTSRRKCRRQTPQYKTQTNSDIPATSLHSRKIDYSRVLCHCLYNCPRRLKFRINKLTRCKEQTSVGPHEILAINV